MGRLLWTTLLLGLLGAGVGLASDRPTAAPLPDTVTVYVATPAGAAVDYSIADAAKHEFEVAAEWLERQTGRTFRRGPDFAEIVHLPSAASAYVGVPEAAVERVLAEVVQLTASDRTFPVVLADLRTDEPGASRRTCAMGGPMGVVVFIDNCAQQGLRLTSTWGSDASAVIAHELVHGLGAVASCAPHASGDGHVTDDPNDVLYHRGIPAHGAATTLDAGRDDYFDHDRPGCPDIADSPLWE